ncbi:D-alanyl-D-alanine carboxypeptidase [Microbacterium resistens]|uniref:D-alanyl-D-alanine carboxypeptidase n=1 Tax=Microbacterium resistens TaxID=156977 RepID=A0ABU1SA80_9MICO|nr:M15 family metallopeptidase [Microbacterium resistens]MDR6866515.1 D-alanyl-D-alanine carboxypeptidase [Microbacterium resistens]
MTFPRRPVARHALDGAGRLRIFVPIGIAVTILGVIWALADGSAANSEPPAAAQAALPRPVVAEHLPAVEVVSVPVADPCADAAVQQAIASGDDNATVVAFGGGAAFRGAVATGNAPCVDLADPSRLWLVVNKARPLTPVRYAPASLGAPALISDDAAGPLRSDVAEALDRMSSAAQDAGVGALGLGSGYRSYDMQVSTYSGQVDAYGPEEADSVSARPGFSEHQTGLAADVEECVGRGGCGGINDFGASPAGAWVAEHCWEHGFIVRYVEGATGSTGYAPEPWHLRYVGTEIAGAYHAGGYTSLESFFGLPDAPDYLP